MVPKPLHRKKKLNNTNPKKTDVKSGMPGGKEVPAPLVAPALSLMVMLNIP